MKLSLVLLIPMLLLGMGFAMFKSVDLSTTNTQVVESQANVQAIEMFNSKFSVYAGIQNAASVKALMTSIQSSNGTNPSHQITITQGSIGETPGAVQASVKSQSKYLIEFEYREGYISSVKVTEE